MGAIIISGEDIRRARKTRGLTLEEAGNLFGTSKSVFHQWENDVRSPRPEAAKRLAAWLAQSPEPVQGKQGEVASSLTIPVPAKLAELASELGVDIESLFATVGIEVVQAELKRLLQAQNAEAIAQHNAYIEENGIPLADLRVW